MLDKNYNQQISYLSLSSPVVGVTGCCCLSQVFILGIGDFPAHLSWVAPSGGAQVLLLSFTFLTELYPRVTSITITISVFIYMTSVYIYSMVPFFLSQDQELEELKQRVNTLTSQNEQLQATVTQQVSQIQQHKDQYNLLKVQLGRFHE